MGILEQIASDVRYGLRTFVIKPAFAVAIVSIGLAIGATVAVYHNLDWMLNRPPDGVQDPDRLVTLGLRYRDRPDLGQFGMDPRQVDFFRENQDLFTDIATYAKLAGVLSDDLAASEVVIEFVSGSYFPLLGIQPFLGSVFTEGDDVPGGPAVAVLSHAFWVTHFGADPGVVGRTVRVNGQSVAVMGVLSPDYQGYAMDWNGPPSLYIPFHIASQVGAGRTLDINTVHRVLGRLRPDANYSMVESSVPTWTSWISPLRDPNPTLGVTEVVAQPSTETKIASRESAQSFLEPLVGICFLVLLAACANLANLSLGRALGRRRELAVRAALGEPKRRLLQRMLTEALLVGTLAFALALVFGRFISQALSRLPDVYLETTTPINPIITATSLSSRVVVMALILGAATALLFGFLPALFASSASYAATLRDRRAPWSWSGLRLTARQVVLVLQVALAVSLGVVAGLQARSFGGVTAIARRYPASDSLLVARINLSALVADQRGPVYAEVLDRVSGLPGTVAASIGWNPPFQQGFNQYSAPSRPTNVVEAGSTAVSPRFFEAQGVTMLAGREFTTLGEDLDGAIVNQTLAAALWPEEDPIGQPIQYGTVLRHVIGVAADERCQDVLGDPGPCGWQAFPPTTGSGYARIHTRGPALELLPELRELVREVHPDASVSQAISLESHIERLTGAQRVSALLAATLALGGLFLCVVGCATLFLSMVAGSLREIAVRVAVGAGPTRLALRILQQGWALTAVGVAIGLVGAWLAAQRITGLYQVSSNDLFTYVAVPILIVLTMTLSVGYAARAAIAVEPSRHLRIE